MPKMIGSTQTKARFNSYVKEEEYIYSVVKLSEYADSDEPEPEDELMDIFYRSKFKYHL
jgi:hypothetical protein